MTFDLSMIDILVTVITFMFGGWMLREYWDE